MHKNIHKRSIPLALFVLVPLVLLCPLCVLVLL